MEPLRSEEPAAERPGLVSRAARIRDPPRPRAVLEAAEAPRTFWAAPGEATVVGSGAAATITDEGPDRFHAVRAAAAELFSAGDVHARAMSARPRLFGGFSFHDEYSAEDSWKGYPGAKFVLPRVQVTYDDEGAWLSVNAVDADPETVEARLETARGELPAAGSAAAPGGPPGVRSRQRTTSKAE